MIGRLRAAIGCGIVLCVIPVTVWGQTFSSMPPSTVNNRFDNYGEVTVTNTPVGASSLSVAG
ncbi:MAG TPA: hypothetical protein VKA08_06945 [Balneolales bacterium]|nr:hypothetical protein [Balneolales bacterium]